MIFYMSSSSFQKYINTATDKEILHATYFMVSSRIRRSSQKYSNIIVGSQTLYPWDSVLSMIEVSDMKARYYNQLSEEQPYEILLNCVRESILHDSTIIFLCTDIEMKNLKYLKYLSNFVYEQFGYPVYDYGKYIKGKGIKSFNRSEVLKEVSKSLKIIERNRFVKQHTTHKGKAALRASYDKYSKKHLIKELKEMDLYTKGMSKQEMIDTIKNFN